MKKTILFVLAVAAAMSLNAQQPYTQKLDSVVGSDNFDWSRWKRTYTYKDDAQKPEKPVTVETYYEWRDQAWVPVQMTEVNEASKTTAYYNWNEDGWLLFQEVKSEDTVCGDETLLKSVTTSTLIDSVWTLTARSTYEYDSLCRISLNMDYSGVDTAGVWIESSKYEYAYNDEGLLETFLYSTKRNNTWRESQKWTYHYNEQGQCDTLLSQSKGGGWGPFGNSWRDSYRYVFEYDNGELVSEYYFASTGWFGGDLALDSKVEYTFDANGNLLTKTASITNDEKGWIVRDAYENRFDPTVDASTVLGLIPFWESFLNKGMGYALGTPMPLKNQWLSCSVVSASLDTEFTLYCSGFAAVDEYQEESFKVYSREGGFMVDNQEPTDITVYDLLGRVIATKTQVQQCSFQLNPGFYVVSNGQKAVKAVVR